MNFVTGNTAMTTAWPVFSIVDLPEEMRASDQSGSGVGAAFPILPGFPAWCLVVLVVLVLATQRRLCRRSWQKTTR